MEVHGHQRAAASNYRRTPSAQETLEPPHAGSSCSPDDEGTGAPVREEPRSQALMKAVPRHLLLRFLVLVAIVVTGFAVLRGRRSPSI